MTSLSKARTGFFFGIILALLVMTAPAFVSAQSVTTTQAEVIATVNLQNASITSQKNGVIGLSFDIANGAGVQTGVKYGVSLVKQVKKRQIIADTQVYPATLTLLANSTTHESLSYTAPSSLNGPYQLLLEAKTASGLPLGINMLGEITLAPLQKTLEILPETCSGVETLTCTVKNYTSAPVSAMPVFETHQGSLYGATIATQGNATAISFKPKETKKITFMLPKATHAGSYEVAIALATPSGKTNRIIARYIVAGASATIDNALLDKTSYLKGDMAHVSLFWRSMSTTSALTLTTTMTQKDSACAAPQMTSLAGSAKKESLTLPITADCPNPLVMLTIKDAEGATLATTVLDPNPKSATTQEEASSSLAWMIALLIGLIAGVTALILKQRSSSTPPTQNDMTIKSLFALLILSSSLFLGAGEARADTFYSFESKPVVVNIDQVTSESVLVTGMFNDNGVHYSYWLKAWIDATPAGSGYSPVSPIGEILSSGALFGSTSLIPPTTPGAYYVQFLLARGGKAGVHYSMPVTIAPACVANVNQACPSSPNSCGQTQSNGTIQCDGSCSSTAPTLPSGYGNSCTSPANACGMTDSSGTIQCTSSCSSITPSNSLCLTPTVQINFQ